MTKCTTCGSTVKLNDGKSTTRYYIPQDELLLKAIELLKEFVDDEPCSLDHRGYCQAHDSFGGRECLMTTLNKKITFLQFIIDQFEMYEKIKDVKYFDPIIGWLGKFS